MADVDQGGEGRAEQGGDQRAACSCQHGFACIVAVAAGQRGFNIVERFQEEVDRQWDGCNQVWRHQRQALEQDLDLRDGNGDRCIGNRLGQRAYTHVTRCPAKDDTNDDGYQAGGDLAGEFDVGQPADKDDTKGDHAQPGHVPGIEGSAHGDIGDGNARQRSEHGGARGQLLHGGSYESADGRHNGMDETPGHAHAPERLKIGAADFEWQHDRKCHQEVMRHRDAVRYGRHIIAAFLFGQPVCHIGEIDISHGQREHQAGHDPAKQDLIGEPDHELHQRHCDQGVGNAVGAQSKETV